MYLTLIAYVCQHAGENTCIKHRFFAKQTKPHYDLICKEVERKVGVDGGATDTNSAYEVK